MGGVGAYWLAVAEVCDGQADGSLGPDRGAAVDLPAAAWGGVWLVESAFAGALALVFCADGSYPIAELFPGRRVVGVVDGHWVRLRLRELLRAGLVRLPMVCSWRL